MNHVIAASHETTSAEKSVSASQQTTKTSKSATSLASVDADDQLQQVFRCRKCKKEFDTSENLQRHYNLAHAKQVRPASSSSVDQLPM